MKIHVIIPSGGRGKRLGSILPKQYVKYHDKELIAYTINIFQKCSLIDDIVIAAESKYFEILRQIKSKYEFGKVINIVEGGIERQNSVYNALLSITAADDDLIVVHDAARPLLPIKILENAIKTAIEYDNAVVAIKAKDTLVKGNTTVEKYIDRNEIYYIQTPQVFRYANLKKAMLKAEEENFKGTDESMLLKFAGFNIIIVEGSPINFKVTTTSDADMFERISKDTW